MFSTLFCKGTRRRGAHGCSYVPGGSHILTCADVKTIKLWDAAKWNDVPVDTIVSKHMVKLLTIHLQNSVGACLSTISVSTAFLVM